MKRAEKVSIYKTSRLFWYNKCIKVKGDEIYLSVPSATVEDITRDGSVVLSFSSEVIDCKSGESITTAVLKSGEDSLTVRKEYENGNSAVTTLWLIGFRRE